MVLRICVRICGGLLVACGLVLLVNGLIPGGRPRGAMGGWLSGVGMIGFGVATLVASWR